MTMIEITNLTHRFSNGKIGLDGISLTIEKGSFVVVAGPNGSGKTTLLRHLNGLLLPDDGSVAVDGRPVSTNIKRTRQVVGMVFQDPDSQIVGQTAYEDVAFGPENLKMDSSEVRQRVAEALETVGLTDFAGRRPYLFSSGQKRRLAIAGILAMTPKVLVFDEPFSNLDYPGIQQVLLRIVSLHQQGRTIIFATHDLEKVVAHADRLILLNEGKVVEDGPPADIMALSENFGIRAPCAVRMGLTVESWLN